MIVSEIICREDFYEGSYIPHGLHWGRIIQQHSNRYIENYITVNFHFGSTEIRRDIYSGKEKKHRRWFLLFFAWGIKPRTRMGIFWVTNDRS